MAPPISQKEKKKKRLGFPKKKLAPALHKMQVNSIV